MISLCIPTWNRTDMLYEAFRQVINDYRISEIVIVDDASNDEVYHTIAWQTKSINKVKLYRNEKNLDCYRNKREAVSKASNEWVILFDSDNILTKQYVDRICDSKVAWSKNQIFQPQAALPHFKFNSFKGTVINRHNVSTFMVDMSFQTMLNAMNYFVNRDEYLKVWDGSVDPVTSDSIYFNYCWLKAGNSIYVVPGLEYEHRVHEESHYQKNVRRTPSGFHDKIVNELKSW